MSLRTLVSGVTVIALLQAPEVARPWFTDVFPPEEFAARRARVYAEIGDGVAILQGATERPAESPFRQNNQVFYLTGIEVPRAIVVLDGRTKKTTLYLPDSSRRARQYGPLLDANEETVRITGVEAALPNGGSGLCGPQALRGSVGRRDSLGDSGESMPPPIGSPAVRFSN